MPTYQYACTACDHRFEAVQRFSDASLTECPVCSGVLRKVFSSVGIVFKGSGFYRTDSRAGAGSTVSGDAKSGEGTSSKDGGEKKAAASTDTKKSEPATSSSSSGSSGTAAAAAKS